MAKSLHEVMGVYGLHSHFPDRLINDSELDKIIDACELLSGKSRDKWLNSMEIESRKIRDRARALEIRDIAEG